MALLMDKSSAIVYGRIFRENFEEIFRIGREPMKFEIWKKEIVRPKPTLFKLEQYGDCVRLIVVNDAGNPVEGGNILQFTVNGTIELFSCVNGKLGFELNSDGQVVTGSY